MDNSQQIVLDYQNWLASLIKPRVIKADTHESSTKTHNEKIIIIKDTDDE
jgi:hypothetical protein